MSENDKTTNSTGEKEFFTVSELAERWSIARTTIRYWIIDGDLPAHRLNPTRPQSHFRILAEDVYEFEALREKQRKQ